MAFPKNEILSRVFLFKELLDTDYSLSWLGRIAGCLQKEWKGCFPGCQAKAVLSLKGIEGVVGICMGTGKIRATLMITQKKESPWLILLLYVGGLRIAVWWSSFWWFFAQITYCSVAAMVLLPRLVERIGERGENRLLLERQKTYTKMSCRHSMLLAIV